MAESKAKSTAKSTATSTSRTNRRSRRSRNTESAETLAGGARTKSGEERVKLTREAASGAPSPDNVQPVVEPGTFLTEPTGDGASAKPGKGAGSSDLKDIMPKTGATTVILPIGGGDDPDRPTREFDGVACHEHDSVGVTERASNKAPKDFRAGFQPDCEDCLRQLEHVKFNAERAG